ncbi:MAG: 30S ribosomal protein S5, partial [Candidatus Micrarchaeota archaeon]|nr:30S ribosomal protein S5 [Candidatus Micrarchaeota archaeon]
MYRPRRNDDEERKPTFNIEAWEPKTDLGRKVKAREITSLEEIFHESRRIEEPEIVEALLPNLKSDVIEITSVQRMTKNNRKQKFKVVAVVGDQMGHVGIGSGKNVEVKAAIDSAIVDAKR